MSLLERVFHFHQEILRGNYPNSRTLIDHFEISPATARRDIAYLRDRLLAPLAFDARRNGFYYSTDGFRLPFTDSPKVILLLSILGKLAEESGLAELDEVRQLEARLAAMISGDHKKVAEAVSCQWIEVEAVDHDVFARVIEAVMGPFAIDFSYQPIGREAGRRTVIPQRIINYQGRWYLLAHCLLRKAGRLFHFSRMTDVRLDRQRPPEPVLLDETLLDRSFGIFHGEARYRARILFSGIAAELVGQQRWHRDQQLEHRDDGVVLTVPVNDDRELLMKILQYGSLATVLEPRELAAKVRAEVQAMAARYRRLEGDGNG